MQATKDRRLVGQSPLVVALVTHGDRMPDWLRAGQALSAVLLTAAARGVSASFLNQPAEVPDLRRALQRLLDTDLLPQLVLRLGYTKSRQRPTPRRPVADVLVAPTA